MSFSRRTFPLAALVSTLATTTGLAQPRPTGEGAQGASGPTIFASRAEAAKARIPEGVRGHGLVLTGFGQAGDGGAAFYRHAEGRPELGAAFQSADGAWWVLAEPSPNVRMFGAKGDGIHDDTAALQSAIDSGLDLIFPPGDYRAGNLRQDRNYQTFFGVGRVLIRKNADGPLIQSSGHDVSFLNIAFRGESAAAKYAGDNIVSSGDHLRLVNCGSRWARGRALKATGNGCQLLGSCDIYHTADESSAGYDIEIGVKGRATLYHQIYAIATGHAAGGILLIDTGSHVISGGCQIGKLTIMPGTQPRGVNGGMTANSRIVGDVSVGVSNAVFSGNQFGQVKVTIEKQVSGVSIDASNIFETGSTVASLGNGNCLVERNTSTGGLPRLSYGPDGDQVSIGFQGLPPLITVSGGIRLDAQRPIQVQSAAKPGVLNVHSANALDHQFFGDAASALTSITSGAGGLYLGAGGASRVHVAEAHLRPQRDGALALGGPANRWATVYSAAGVLQTSDARLKTDVAPISDRLLDAWAEVPKRQFRWVQTPEKLSVGVVAQEIVEVFDRHGLDALSLGLIRHDHWDSAPSPEDAEASAQPRPVATGDRYSVDYDQVATLDHALQSRRLSRLEQALERQAGLPGGG